MSQENVFMRTSSTEDTGVILELAGGLEPAYVASEDTTDPYVIALAEMMLWTEQFKDHCEDIAFRLQQASMAEYREMAIMYMGSFDLLHERAMETELDPNAISELSDQVVSKTQELIDFKRELKDMQDNGDMYSFLASSYLDHLIREAEYIVSHQQELIDGNVRADRDSIIEFWAHIIEEHSAYTAQFIDPEEESAIERTTELKEKFRHIMEAHDLEGNTDPIPQELNEVVDFNTQLLNNVESALIKSALYPELPDHYRRETLYFKYELMRADKMSNIKAEAA